MMFPIVQVSSQHVESLEPLGTKRKFWFEREGKRLLFKAEERGLGEDWAEKVACELCRLLGLPHVHYELARDTHAQVPGVVCETCAPAPVELKMGNELLVAKDPQYPESKRFKVRQYTVDTVAGVIADLKPPPRPWADGLPPGIESPLDVFIGYVMLDAWIANQDRHHENWGALAINGELFLAPTYDHGGAMARNLTDEERRERLNSRDTNRQIPFFVRRATSAFYSDPPGDRPIKTFEAWQAFSHKSMAAAKVWLDRLRMIEDGQVRELLKRVPPERMSPVALDFTHGLLAENRKRLLAGDEP